jgi:hypothetical protein
MDPIKVIIFVAAFLLLLLLGRKLSGSGDAPEFPAPYEGSMPSIGGPAPPVQVDEDEDSTPDTSRVVGADLPFPIKLPEIERSQDGRFNRPEFLNYYFEKTDLKSGPPDPTNFYDDFYVMTRDIESNYERHYKYLVATPTGLQSVLASKRVPALYVEDQTVIVPRWDVPLILETVIKQIMKTYAEPDDKETHALPNEDA